MQGVEQDRARLHHEGHDVVHRRLVHDLAVLDAVHGDAVRVDLFACAAS